MQSPTNQLTHLVIENKKIIDFYQKNKHIDLEKVNLFFINLFNDIFTNMSGEFTESVTKEIISSLKIQSTELTSLKNEINEIIKSNADNYKTELLNVKTIQTLSNSNIVTEIHSLKDSVNRINTELTSFVMSKFYDIRKDYTHEIELLFNKNGNDTIAQLVDRTKKDDELLIDKINSIIKEFIPTSQNQYYNQHEITIRNFKDDISKCIESAKTDVSIDKLNLIMNEKYNYLISSVEKSVLGYIISSEERLSNNIHQTIFSNLKNDITELKNISNSNNFSQTKLNTDLQSFLNQYKIGMKKGEFGENLLLSILTNLFPSSEIIDTTGQTSSGDFILKRENKVQILFENKNYDSCNVQRKEVEKFIYDAKLQNCSAIMISQKSGIVMKKNFQIDINNNNVLIYIHNMNYEPEKILLACDIIDNLTSKINQLNNGENSIKITETAISLINEQYQRFITKKNTIIFQLNENTKKIIESIKELELEEVNNILSNHFANFKNNTTNTNTNLFIETKPTIENETTNTCPKCHKIYKQMKSYGKHILSCNN